MNEWLMNKLTLAIISPDSAFWILLYALLIFLPLLGLFSDDLKTRPVVEKYVQTMHNVQPYIKYVRALI